MSTSIFDLTGKVAVVTGGGRGLSRTMAMGLADAGAKVVVCTRTKADVDAVAAEINDRGGDALAIAFDATSREDCQRLMDETIKAYGRLDVMLVGHGVSGTVVDAEDTTIDDFENVVAINITGCFNAAQFAARQMIKQGDGGSIILVSSTSSLVAFPGIMAYGASKGGVDQMMREMAAVWGTHNIRVNTINPGYTTHAMKGVGPREPDPEHEAHVRRMTPLERQGEPAEFAGPAIFLASDASSFVTGVVLPVDGGYCIL